MYHMMIILPDLMSRDHTDATAEKRIDKNSYYYKCNGKNSETGRTFFCKQGVVLQYRLIKASKNSRSLNNNGAAQIQLSRS